MGRFSTPLCDTLDIEYPIIQAGMGRGIVYLAAAVSNAGGLGTMGTPGDLSMGPNEVRGAVESNFEVLTSTTDGSVAVNCLVGGESDARRDRIDAVIDEILVEKLTNNAVAEQLKLLETSGGTPEPWIEDIKDVTDDTDLLHFHKVGSVKHAKKAVELGVDGITASGYEMGGHTHHPDRAIHTLVLVPAVVDAVDVPVVASGGIRDGRGILAALALGAQAGYLGSRFIATQECDYHPEYKEHLVAAGEWDDSVEDGFVSPVRVLDSPGIDVIKHASEQMDADEFAAFKDQKWTEARNYGKVDEGFVVAGQTATYINDIPTVEELMNELVDEAVARYNELQIE